MNKQQTLSLLCELEEAFKKLDTLFTPVEADIQHKIVDGYHVFTSEFNPLKGLYVLSKDFKAALNAVVPSVVTILVNDLGLPIKKATP